MVTFVIRSRTKEKISGTFSFEWSVHEAVRNRAGTLFLSSRMIDRQKALAIIEKHGLVECYRTRDGEIYDTKERDLKALFPQGIKDKNDEYLIEKTDRL